MSETAIHATRARILTANEQRERAERMQYFTPMLSNMERHLQNLINEIKKERNASINGTA